MDDNNDGQLNAPEFADFERIVKKKKIFKIKKIKFKKGSSQSSRNIKKSFKSSRHRWKWDFNNG